MGAHRDSLAVEAFAEVDRDDAESAGEVLPSAFASLDNTLPPTPLKDLLAADGAAIFVLSRDGELSQAVEKAGGEQFPIFIVERWSDLVDAVTAQRTHIVLLDSAALDQPIEASLDELASAADALIVVVAAERHEAEPLMRLMSERKIHRLLIKPAAQGITRLLLESAVSRYLQWRDQQQPRVLPAESLPSAGSIPRRRRPQRKPVSAVPWLLATVLVTLLAGGAVWVERVELDWRVSADQARTWLASLIGSRGDEAAIGATASGELRSAAGPAGAAGRDVAFTPDQPDASVAASTPAQRDPSNRAPMPGQRDASNTASTPGQRDASNAASTSGLSDSPVAADPIDAFAPSDPLVTAAGSPQPDISAPPRSTGTAVDAEPPASPGASLESPPLAALDDAVPLTPEQEAAEAELVALLRQLDLRLTGGQLVGPGDDNALSYFEQVMALNPYDPRVLTRRTSLAAGLVDESRLALERGAIGDAQFLAEQAFHLGAERESIARLELELDRARRERVLERHAALLARARALMQEDRLTAADGDGALVHLAALRRESSGVPGLAEAWRDLTNRLSSGIRAAIASGDFTRARALASALAIRGGDAELAADLEFEARQAEFLATPSPSGTLQLVESLPLVYPAQAQRSGAEGWADVEFIVDREGRTRDISVVGSRPRRIFDEAAAAAVSAQRYAPFELDGRVYERLLRVRVRFELE